MFQIKCWCEQYWKNTKDSTVKIESFYPNVSDEIASTKHTCVCVCVFCNFVYAVECVRMWLMLSLAQNSIIEFKWLFIWIILVKRTNIFSYKLLQYIRMHAVQNHISYFNIQYCYQGFSFLCHTQTNVSQTSHY